MHWLILPKEMVKSHHDVIAIKRGRLSLLFHFRFTLIHINHIEDTKNGMGEDFIF